jgi:predicted Zn-dependent protease
MILLVSFSFYYIYDNLPLNPTKLSVEEMTENPEELIDYGDTPMFAENIRFSKNDVSYYINDSCPISRMKNMREAFGIIENSVEGLSFSESINKDSAEIYVGCSNEEVYVGENFFAVGEGGPTKVIKIGRFNLIEEGRIHLYKDSNCNYPVTELHELLHVLGFDHSENPKSIMYDTYGCDQRVTPDIIEILNELYSIESLPDLRINKLDAVKKGRYLDFNITIINEGMADVEVVELVLLSGEKEISSFVLDNIYKGYARTLTVQNLRMFSNNIEVIEFYVDYENEIDEIDEENNYAKAFS